MMLQKLVLKEITREGVLETCKGRSLSKTTKAKLKDLQGREIFLLAPIVGEPIMLRRIVGTKINLLFIGVSAINLVTVRSIAEPRKKISTANTTTCKCD